MNSGVSGIGYAAIPRLPPQPKMQPRRATQACEGCRKKKRGCDETQPCFFCVEEGRVCIYRDKQAEKDKAFANLHDQLVKKLDTVSNNFSERLTQLEKTLLSLMDAQELRITRATSSCTINGRQDVHFAGCYNRIKSWPSVRGLLMQSGLSTREERVRKGEMRDLPSSQTQQGVSVWNPQSYEATTQCCFSGNSCAGCELEEYFESNTAERLLRSYVQHIHTLHPFLDLAFVNDVLARFEINGTPCHQKWKHEDLTVSDDTENPRKRRKVSEDCVDSTCIPSGNPATGARLPPEYILLLLILALGEVCESKQVSRKVARSEPGHSTGIVPIGEQHYNTNRFRSPPGNVCYDKAMEAIGCHLDGNDLLHAQIYILAGLYKGQLGRASESLHWYCMAGRICQTLLFQTKLVRSDHSINRDEIQQIVKQRQSWIVEPAHDLIVLTSWTCLQLESDTLTDLPLPSSGLELYEDVIPWPLNIPGHTAFDCLFRSHGTFETLLSSYDMLLHYTAQIWLQKLSNRIQRQLYGSECLHMSHKELRNVIRNHQQALQLWRNSLPAALCWSDDYVPASDVLTARLRAKYWDACVFVNQPILDYAIHIMPNVKHKSDIEAVAVDAQGAPRRAPEIELFKSIFDMPEDEISRAVDLCLQAAVQSTVAFKGVSGVPILTNPSGTAHAQLGNVLVLSVASLCPTLRSRLPHSDLNSLVQHAINFLNGHSHFSPTCETDCETLRQLRVWLGCTAPKIHI